MDHVHAIIAKVQMILGHWFLKILPIWALIEERAQGDQGLERQGTLPKGSAEPLRSSGY